METVTAIATGTPELDSALGIGGLARRRVVEVFGALGSGRLQLVLRAIAAAQRAGLVCAFIDVDQQFDTNYAEKMGIDLGKLLVSQPQSPEQAFDVIDTLIRTGALDLVVVTGLGDLDDDHPQAGLRARYLSRFLRKITAALANINTCLLFMSDGPTGCSAVRFYSSVRVCVTRAPAGCHVKVVKNKCAAPFTDATIAVEV